MATNTFDNNGGGGDLKWWTATNWDLGHAPTDGEDVALAGFVVEWDYAAGATIPATGTLNSITSTGTAGQLTVDATSGNHTLLCTTITAGKNTTGLINITGASGNTVTVGAGGNTTTITGSSAASASGIMFNSTCVLTIYGNVNGGSWASAACGVNHYTTGTLNITGNVTGGNFGTGVLGIQGAAVGAINITGTVTGGASGNGVSHTSKTLTINNGPIVGGGGNAGIGVNAGYNGTNILNNVNMVNSATTVAWFGKSPTWNNDDSNYAQWGATKYGPEPDHSEMLWDVVCGSTTGNVVLPDVEVVIESSPAYGPGPGLIGTYFATAVGDVEAGVTFGAERAETGTLGLPAVGEVESGVGYGEDDTEFTGTLAAGGGGAIFNSPILQG